VLVGPYLLGSAPVPTMLFALSLHDALPILTGGAPDAGWTSYASLAMQSPGHGVDYYVAGLQIAGAGTLMGGINFLATIVTMRAPGMTYMRMPLFSWATFV